CLLCCFFFFQAEDGIRDRNVTGVQTCALPISDTKNVERIRQELAGAEGSVLPIAVGGGTINDVVKRAAGQVGLPYVVVGTAASRSEERRVGKGGEVAARRSM